MDSAFSVYTKLFKNPAAVIFLIMFFILYTLFGLAYTSREPIEFLEIIKAVPFAVSALVLGVFSIIFWALNYVGKTKKSEMRCIEAERLFEIRRGAIEKIFSDADVDDSLELAVLKAHLLLSANELDYEPETPAASLAFDYGDAVKAILRKS